MKKLLFSAALFAASITTYAQVGIGTTAPVAGSALHIDGAKDNAVTPTDAQLANDVVVTDAGKVGIGTTTPTSTLEIKSGDGTPDYTVLNVANYTTTAATEKALNRNVLNLSGGSSGPGSYNQSSLITVDGANNYSPLNTTVDYLAAMPGFSGVASSMRANYAIVWNNSATTGRIDSAVGYLAEVRPLSATGIIREAIGLYTNIVRATGTDAGATHSAYGLYVGEVTASGGATNSAYSVFTVSSAPSYFGGNIGIGAFAPKAKLDVSGLFNAQYGQITTGSVGNGGAITFLRPDGIPTNYVGSDNVDGTDFYISNRSGGANVNILGSNTIVLGSPVAYPNIGLTAASLVVHNTSGNVGIGIGITAPTSRLQVVGLVDYATDAAAGAAGLTAGAFYHTAGVVKVKL